MRALWLAVVVVLASTGSGVAEPRLPAIVQLATVTRMPPLPRTAFGRLAFLDIIAREAGLYGLPSDVADAVAQIESGYDPGVVGSVGEIGLMQVRPATANMLGFTGSADDLARPEVNIHFGVRYLAKAWRLAGGDLCRALMKYRAGHGEESMTPLSANYCARAKAHLVAIHSKVAFAKLEIAPLKPAAVSKAAEASRPKQKPAAKAGLSFWEAHEARIRAINAKIEARWRQRGAKV